MLSNSLNRRRSPSHRRVLERALAQDKFKWWSLPLPLRRPSGSRWVTWRSLSISTREICFLLPGKAFANVIERLVLNLSLWLFFLGSNRHAGTGRCSSGVAGIHQSVADQSHQRGFVGLREGRVLHRRTRFRLTFCFFMPSRFLIFTSSW